jgi:hypothetical protein
VGFSVCPHCESTLLYVFNPFPCSLLPFYPPTHPHYFNSFQYISLHLCLHRCYVLWLCWCSVVLFSFLSFSKFHRVVPLLQTCSTLWVSVGSCLFLCVCLSFGSVFHVWEKIHGFCLSQPGLLYLTLCPFTFQPDIVVHYGWVKFHCVYISLFKIYSSVVGHLGFPHSLAIVNSAVMNIIVQVSVLYPVLTFLYLYS